MENILHLKIKSLTFQKMWLMTRNFLLGPIYIKHIFQNGLQCLESFLYNIIHVLNLIYFLLEQF
jgi:hypothetical protein